MTLSPRQQSILNRIVEAHVETAQPVGSRFITELYTDIYSNSYSPATVRQEMVRLEDLGYLTHPHTSAGRVPTDQGYRYYVDHSMRREEIAEDVLSKVNQDLMLEAVGVENAAEIVSSALSKLSEEVSVVIVNGPADQRKKGFRFFLQGSSLILDKPEFKQDLEQLRMLLKIFEEKSELSDWLMSRAPESGVSVSIGSENRCSGLQHCSVVVSRCETGESKSVMALLGPRRMRYARAVSLVSRMSRMLRNVFENFETRGNYS